MPGPVSIPAITTHWACRIVGRTQAFALGMLLSSRPKPLRLCVRFSGVFAPTGVRQLLKVDPSGDLHSMQ
jgi:hypothetical protein